MAKGLQRKRQRQQQAAELQHYRSLALEAAPRHAFSHPPLHRPAYQQWDWECGTCGHVNFAGRTLCHRHLCIGPRSKGHSMVGFLRGVLQTDAAAQVARQQQLHALSLPSAYNVTAERPRAAKSGPAGALPHNVVGVKHFRPDQQQQQAQQKRQQLQQQAPTRRVLQPPKPHATMRQGTATGDSGGYARSPPAPGKSAGGAAADQSDNPQTFAQLAEAENEDVGQGGEEEEEFDHDETDFEDLDANPLYLRKRHVRLAKALERRQKRLVNERTRIENQVNEIAAQQAKLVELQTVADSTAQEIVSIQGKITATCQQIARIEDEKNKETAATVPADAPADGVLTPAQHARDCLERTVVAFQHFQGQCPEVQNLLQQFSGIFDSIRAAPAAVDTRQPTLEQVFARAATSTAPAAHSPVAASSLSSDVAQSTSKPQAFDIGSEASAAVAESEAIRVDGHNLGDKRKQEHVQDAERISREEAAHSEEKTDGSAIGQPAEEVPKSSCPAVGQDGNIEVDAEGPKATPISVRTELPPKTYTKLNDLRKDLEAQNVKQAAAARQRCSPYGHG